MSILGKVEARCPNGCQARDVEIWSFINGDQDSTLRESLLAGDLNLISCDECGGVFYPESTVVFYAAKSKMLAFVFPESYRGEEDRWHRKMEEDFAEMQKIIPLTNGLVIKPQLYFGIDSLRQQLQAEEELRDEVEIAAVLSHELKLTLYPVDRVFARSHNLPWLLPYRGSASESSINEGLHTLLKANDRLEGYKRWQNTLKTFQGLPPKN
jgi:hypothetical protein